MVPEILKAQDCPKRNSNIYISTNIQFCRNIFYLMVNLVECPFKFILTAIMIEPQKIMFKRPWKFFKVLLLQDLIPMKRFWALQNLSARIVKS